VALVEEGWKDSPVAVFVTACQADSKESLGNERPPGLWRPWLIVIVILTFEILG
jgi:hypothetical protein